MLVQTAAASSEPVSVAEAKAHLRLTHSADDALLARQLVAAREFVEAFTGRALAEATYRYTSSGFGLRAFPVPLWPIDSIDSVSYLDTSEERVTLAGGDYLVDLERSVLRPVGGVWPLGSDVNVEFSTAPEFIPEALKSAILARVQAEYEAQPEEAEKLRAASEALAWPWRRGLGA